MKIRVWFEPVELTIPDTISGRTAAERDEAINEWLTSFFGDLDTGWDIIPEGENGKSAGRRRPRGREKDAPSGE